MHNSAAPFKTESTVTYLYVRDRKVETPPLAIRFPWTEELERRRKAVARWRGSEEGLKEAMMRD